MTRIITLDPHDPLPDHGEFALVIRRFGEDDPKVVITEIDFFGRHRTMSVAVGADGKPLPWADVLVGAQKDAESRGYTTLYAVDRTAGPLEQEVLAHQGDHSAFAGPLSDTDPEDGVHGSSLLDRPHDAGFMR